MKRSKRETRYVSILVVQVPSVEALIDNMRYDHCCPATEVESHKIERLINGTATSVDHVIRLFRFASGDVPATVGRWRSFNCRVLDERSTAEEQLTEAEALNLAKIGWSI